MNRLQFVITIVPAGRGSDVAQATNEVSDISGGIILQGEGTAGADIWDTLGVTKERELVISITPQDVLEVLSANIHKKLGLSKSGQGILFVIPMSRFLNKAPNLTEEVLNMSAQHELLLVRMRSGFGKEVMETAKQAGATGGTLVHGRSAGSEVKFFNISLEEEADMLFIVTETALTKGIIKAIAEKHGRTNCVSIALPVTQVLGI